MNTIVQNQYYLHLETYYAQATLASVEQDSTEKLTQLSQSWKEAHSRLPPRLLILPKYNLLVDEKVDKERVAVCPYNAMHPESVDPDSNSCLSSEETDHDYCVNLKDTFASKRSMLKEGMSQATKEINELLLDNLGLIMEAVQSRGETEELDGVSFSSDEETCFGDEAEEEDGMYLAFAANQALNL
jgi:hypothetical protein